MPNEQYGKVLRALDVLKRVSFKEETLEFDVKTVCACLDLPIEPVVDTLIANGGHVVSYMSPKLAPYLARVDAEMSDIRRVAKFAPFRSEA